jgi:hypothetical protein
LLRQKLKQIFKKFTRFSGQTQKLAGFPPFYPAYKKTPPQHNELTFKQVSAELTRVGSDVEVTQLIRSFPCQRSTLTSPR